jgi:hypothetical protein
VAGKKYTEESLNDELRKYGFFRKSGESDWSFRKRVFPDFFQKDAKKALEFFTGNPVEKWDKTDELFNATLFMGKYEKLLDYLLDGLESWEKLNKFLAKERPNRQECKSFADDFFDDPRKERKK